jgi:DNA-binding NarL/FixJ family response regulator
MDILLVEDEPQVAASLGDLLRWASPEPFRLLERGTLVGALDLLTMTPVDVILLDLGLPDSQELATLRAIVERWPEVPVIVITGLVDDDVMLQAVDAGAQDFLGKTDLTGPLLWHTIRLAIGRHARQQRLFARLAQVSERLKDEGA